MTDPTTAPRFEPPDDGAAAYDYRQRIRAERQSKFHENLSWHREHSQHSEAYKAKVMERYRRRKEARQQEARHHESL